MSALALRVLRLAACWRLWLLRARRAHADAERWCTSCAPGETLASIAELYYGDPRRESVLVAENGLASEGGSAIVVGLRLVDPDRRLSPRRSTARPGPSSPTRYYGDPQRAFALIEANGGKAGEHPDVGAELLMPYPLRVVASQNDPLRKIAKTYYDSMAAMNIVRRFNQAQAAASCAARSCSRRSPTCVLSAQGKKLAEAQVGAPQLGGDVRKKQTEIDAELPMLRDHVRQGRYADAVAMANRLIGNGDLTSSEVVTIHRELGTALRRARQRRPGARGVHGAARAAARRRVRQRAHVAQGAARVRRGAQGAGGRRRRPRRRSQGRQAASPGKDSTAAPSARREGA